MASDWKEAKSRVIDLVKKMGYTPVDRGDLKSARLIEAIPLQLMPSWHRPLTIVSIMWIIHYLILFLK